DTMAKIYLKAVREGVKPGQEIEGLASAVMQSASDLFGADSHELQVTKDAWDAVGVLKLVQERQGGAAAPTAEA
ncbi:MAG: Thermolysin metallopeptidase alpha-helical domain, partial [Thermoleophilia bacterium]|nr:Thermolysin metallopeptidase alpha-helical domain [Thermoleophilia bacterium]